jgi:uncharacterized membrane protein
LWIFALVDEDIKLLPKGQDEPEVVHQQLAYLFWQVSVNEFRRSSNIVALVMGSYCADQAFFNGNPAVLSLNDVAMLQSYKLRAAWWLPTRHIDEQEQLLEELVHLLKIRLHCFLLPPKLGFWAHMKQFVPQPVVLKYSVEQPFFAALLKLVYIALILWYLEVDAVESLALHHRDSRQDAERTILPALVGPC